jgi:hypothetical protein
MNTEQQAALDMALSGHSFLLTGKAGSYPYFSYQITSVTQSATTVSG